MKMTKTVSKNKIRETDLNKSSEILDYLEKDMDERKKIQQRCKSVFNISSLPDCDHEEVVEVIYISNLTNQKDRFYFSDTRK